MLKELDFNDFYKEENAFIGENGIGGTGLITPSQMVNVINVPGEISSTGEVVDGVGMHITTVLEILNEMFNANIEEITAYDTVAHGVLEKIVPNTDKNFITIRYVANHSCDDNTPVYGAYFTIPMYITPFQLSKLESLDRILKKYNVETDAVISNYNPLTFELEEDTEMKDFYDDVKDNYLTAAIKYLKDNDRVEDYFFPYPEEKVDVKKAKKRTI